MRVVEKWRVIGVQFFASELLSELLNIEWHFSPTTRPGELWEGELLNVEFSLSSALRDRARIFLEARGSLRVLLLSTRRSERLTPH